MAEHHAVRRVRPHARDPLDRWPETLYTLKGARDWDEYKRPLQPDPARLPAIGGYDKLALERGRAAIDAELEAHPELMKEGGLVLMPDHLITPDTPLENYRYYLERVRQLRF